ncbi:MAG: carbon starvation CstA 5TM domain-containing protein, partial [Candidatus Omnitrophota bacterium]
EAIVSIMALIAATVLLPGDYFAINLSADAFAKLGLNTTHLADLERMTSETLTARPGGAVSLAAGMSMILSSIQGMKHLMGYWYHFAIMFEALFILTTVDTGTRVARYIVQEMIKFANPRLIKKKHNSWVIVICSALVSLLWGYLVFNGDISTIWPMFGVANQLLATLALCVGTVFILKHSKRWYYSLITSVPAVFMFTTTVVASAYNIAGNYLPKHTFQGNLNAALSLVMVLLIIIIAAESLKRSIGLLKQRFMFF